MASRRELPFPTAPVSPHSPGKGDLALSFPLEYAGKFNNTPSLICSDPSNNLGLEDHLHQYRGERYPGDVILLATDAMACWMLDGYESGGGPWNTLLSLSSNDEWEDWVQARRSGRSMRNDYTTLNSVEVE